jgi:hypothetical protein
VRPSGRGVPRLTNGRVALLLIAAGGASFAIAAATATGAAAQRVTLAVERVFDPVCQPLPGQAPSAARGCTRLRFTGTISSGAANEYVAVLHQRCGVSGVGTSVVGAQTEERGSWEATWGAAAGTYRARWMDNAGRIGTSEPVRFRDSVPLSLTKLSSYRQRVSVTGDHNMKGRIVELQRYSAGRWRLVRRTRLVRTGGSYATSSSATFIVRRRGLVLRAFVPAKSAAPCYTPTATDEWRSGPAPGAGLGARVIDRTLLCSTGMQGGLRMVSIAASSARGPDRITQGPSLSVSSGFARSPGFASASTTSVTLYPDRCTGSGALVSLKAGNLRGAVPPGPFGTSFDCEAPRRVYLRFRAVFFEPATLERSRELDYQTISAHGQVSEAAVAVRTPSGRPLVFATMVGSKARLFTGRTCIED